MVSLPGINTNVRHRGELYHVQTEVNTVDDRKIVSTLIFLSGTIVHSVKSEVTDKATHDRAVFKSRIELHHRRAIKKLVNDEISGHSGETAKNTDSDTTEKPADFSNFLKKMYKDAPLLYSSSLELPDKINSFRQLLTEEHL